MKKIRVFLIAISLIGIAIITSSCTKTDEDPIPLVVFQGPINPSFETYDGWQFTQAQAYPSIMTGTSFMPTKGLRYMNLNGSYTNNWYTVNCTTYQDNVDFSKSKTLTFDYSYSVTGTVTLEILFTANGTVTLWKKNFTPTAVVPPSTGTTTGGDGAGISNGVALGGSTATTKEQKDEVITLPSLPDTGRLTVKATTVQGSFDFSIDNIRVQ